MGVTIKEIERMLREFMGGQSHVNFLQERNEELRKQLEGIPECKEREGVELEIEANEHSILWRIKNRAAFLRIMEKQLTKEEFEIVRLRHMDRERWDVITYKMNLSRSNCIRIENRGMERLRQAWGRYLEKEQSKSGGE